MIKTQNLTKNYDGLLAVDDLTFTVEPGEIVELEVEKIGVLRNRIVRG